MGCCQDPKDILPWDLARLGGITAAVRYTEMIRQNYVAWDSVDCLFTAVEKERQPMHGSSVIIRIRMGSKAKDQLFQAK